LLPGTQSWVPEQKKRAFRVEGCIGELTVGGDKQKVKLEKLPKCRGLGGGEKKKNGDELKRR